MKKDFNTFLILAVAVFSYFLGYYPNSATDKNDYTIKPKILKVIDGDTVKIQMKERPVNVRLTGIDCYETSPNPHIDAQRNKGLTDEEIFEKGKKAKEELEKIIEGKEILLELTGIDKKYGRLVGILYYKDSENKDVNINDILLNSGYCPKYGM